MTVDVFLLLTLKLQRRENREIVQRSFALWLKKYEAKRSSFGTESFTIDHIHVDLGDVGCIEA
jgi:hypothetical protein